MAKPKTEPKQAKHAEKPEPKQRQVSIMDALKIGVDAIDQAAMAGKYAHLDNSGQAVIREAQAMLSRTAMEIATREAPAKEGETTARKERKKTRPKGGQNARRKRAPSQKKGK